MALGIQGPVYIIMAILILGLGEISTMLALVVWVVPFITNLLYEGVQAQDRPARPDGPGLPVRKGAATCGTC